MSQIELFNYAALAPELQIEVKAATERIKLRMKRTAEDIIEIGKDLIAVKARLPHGQFLPWIAAEFEMSDQTAQNFMNVATRFPQIPNNLEFKPTILYLLAAPSTPEEVVEKAVEKAEQGEPLTLKEIKELKSQLAAKDSQVQKLEAERRSMQGRLEDLVMVVNFERDKLTKAEEEKQQAIAKAIAEKEQAYRREIEQKTKEVEAERKRLEQFKANPDPETAKKAQEAQKELSHLEFELRRAQSKLTDLQSKENNATVAIVKLQRFKVAFQKLLSDHADALIELSSPYLPESILCELETTASAMEDLADKIRDVAARSVESRQSMRAIEVEVLT